MADRLANAWKPAAIAALCIAAAPALAQDGARIGDWQVAANPHDGTCMAYASSGPSFFAIQHADRPEHRFTLVNDARWTSLTNGERYEGTLTIGNSYATTFAGVVDTDITPTVVGNSPADIAAALSRAMSIRVEVPRLKIDASVPVTNGAKIWSALEQCVAEKR